MPTAERKRMTSGQVIQGLLNACIATQVLAIKDRVESAICRLGDVERAHPGFPVVKRFHKSPCVFGLNAQGMATAADRQSVAVSRGCMSAETYSAGVKGPYTIVSTPAWLAKEEVGL
ncbi:MAG: hypothetical protein ACK4FF_05535 [Limnobacter sp.]|uniref:hypothetical protein n=1 Tax=Limnobacter sp. TaxID=2003368 RepID=UPI00391A7064